MAPFIATVGYTGYLPKAPGTFGTLVALPLIFLSSKTVFSIGIFTFVIGWVATYCMLRKQTISDKDPSYIVIDEFAAMALFFGCAGVCGGIDPLYWGQQSIMIFSAFALFRVFDILKPWPISAVDAYFKNKNNVGAAFGVMIDDILAVIFAFPFYYAFVAAMRVYVERAPRFQEILLTQ